VVGFDEDGLLTVVGSLEFGWRDIATGFEETPVEPSNRQDLWMKIF